MIRRAATGRTLRPLQCYGRGGCNQCEADPSEEMGMSKPRNETGGSNELIFPRAVCGESEGQEVDIFPIVV